MAQPCLPRAPSLKLCCISGQNHSAICTCRSQQHHLRVPTASAIPEATDSFTPSSALADQAHLKDMCVPDLRQRCKQLQLSGYSRKTKDALIDLIMKAESPDLHVDE